MTRDEVKYLGKIVTGQYGCGFFKGEVIQVAASLNNDLPLVVRGRAEGCDDEETIVLMLQQDNVARELKDIERDGE